MGITEDGYYYKGDPNAPVKVIKYSDYQCPACRSYAMNLAKIVNRDYIETGKVQFIYHEFPLTQHQNAVPAAEAARCAGEQNKYWEMHDILFARQNDWAELASPLNTFYGYARELGVDSGKFEACMSEGRYTAKISESGQQAIAANIPATPTFFVNGQQVSTAQLVTTIDAALRSAGK